MLISQSVKLDVGIVKSSNFNETNDVTKCTIYVYRVTIVYENKIRYKQICTNDIITGVSLALVKRYVSIIASRNERLFEIGTWIEYSIRSIRGVTVRNRHKDERINVHTDKRRGAVWRKYSV